MKTKTTKIQPTANEMNIMIQTAQTYAEQFMSFKKQSAEGLLRMGKAVSDAKSGHKEVFKKFCILTDLDASSSTCRKYNAIGQNFERLMEHVEKLPNNWTTLYKVASLSPTEFQKLVDSGKLNPCIKAADIREVLGAPASKGSSDSITLSINVPKGLNLDVLQNIFKTLNVLNVNEWVNVNLDPIKTEIHETSLVFDPMKRLAA